MERPMIIGIAGGTGSGKTTVAKKVFQCINQEQVAVIEHDAYYKDQSHIEFEDRLKTNYDHPFDSLSSKFLIFSMLIFTSTSSSKSVSKPSISIRVNSLPS